MGVNAPARTVGDNSYFLECFFVGCSFCGTGWPHMGPGVEIVLICVLIYRSRHDLSAFNQPKE